MRARWLALFVLGCFLLCLIGAPRPTAASTSPAQATLPEPGPCDPGTLAGGARSLICVPSSGWNGDVVYWAHGYVPEGLPLDFYNLSLPDGSYLPDLVQRLGYAFATTSYRTNGLAVPEGVADLRLLAEAFEGRYPPAASGRRAYIAGASEGGLITTLLAEQSPPLFDGALAACGPVGSFRGQVDYWGDFRVLFDYFFPDLLPGSAVEIPPELLAGWETVYRPLVAETLAANPVKLRQLLTTARAAYDPARPETALNTALNLLWYNVFATNNAVAKLGGNPFDNSRRWYRGSANDRALNLGVERYRADPAALAAIAAGYETSGRPRVPVVLPHTTRDEIVPFNQSLRYWLKAGPLSDTALPIAITRYGHCNFTAAEILFSFGLLVRQTTGQSPAHLDAVAESATSLDLAATQAELERQRQAFEADQAAEQIFERSTTVYLPLLTTP